MKIRADEIVYSFICVSGVTRELFDLEPIGHERKGPRLVVARLQLQAVVINRATIQAGRRPGLESLEPDTSSL
jgi:hypothetical protein